MATYGGIDLGGTKIQAIVMGADHSAIGQARCLTPHKGGPAAVVDALVACMSEAAAAAGVNVESLDGVGVGAPGEVNAGRDGEAALLEAPMRFAIRPLALRVRISARHPGASPSAQLSSLDPRRRTPAGPDRPGRP